MTLEVIGAGFGRTGTLSLKVALEQLGLGPCYHMLEVLGTPDRPQQWLDQVEGRPPGWDVVFSGFRATVDWPAAAYWRELAAHYPEARVILSLRDPGKWYDSVMNTIYNAMRPDLGEGVPEAIRVQLTMVRKLIAEQTFGGRLEDRAHAIDVFERHNRAVREAIPAERLLVYEPGDGWEPLCAFLERPVPETDFPRLNDTAEFRARMGLPPVD
jgi:hypothetical protein